MIDFEQMQRNLILKRDVQCSKYISRQLIIAYFVLFSIPAALLEIWKRKILRALKLSSKIAVALSRDIKGLTVKSVLLLSK